MTNPPIVWSIAGTDSGGGAGLSADQRAADAFGVHLCPVVAAVTAQHSRAVTRIEPMSPDVIDAQLSALADDMPPRVVKTGLLGGAAQVELVARWVDRLRREHGPVALVVDPVLASSSGAAFADAATLAAYREHLLPRATLVTPNRREAAMLAGSSDDVPGIARALQAAGTQSVCITGGDSDDALALDWLASEHACGWLALPRIDTRHNHGTGCTFASSAAAALALGFVAADAVVLAKMSASHALRHGRAAGAGAGPVIARAGFASDPSLLPAMSFGSQPPRWSATHGQTDRAHRPVRDRRQRRARGAGARGRCAHGPVAHQDGAGHGCVARRNPSAASPPAAKPARGCSSTTIGSSPSNCVRTACTSARKTCKPSATTVATPLATSGLALGISSHSLWELARAATPRAGLHRLRPGVADAHQGDAVAAAGPATTWRGGARWRARRSSPSAASCRRSK